MDKLNLPIISLVIVATLLVGVVFVFSQQKKPEYLTQEVLWDRAQYELKVQRIDDQIVQIEAYKDGEPFDLFENEILIHTTIMSPELDDIDHNFLFSESDQVSPGVYRLSYSFKQDHNYLMWVETNNVVSRDHHVNSSDFASLMRLSSEGNTNDVDPDTNDVDPDTNDVFKTDDYEMMLTKNNVSTNEPGRLTVQVKRNTEDPVELQKDYDHFYTVVSYDEEYYHTSHVDQHLLEDNNLEVSTQPIQVPKPGKYVLWIRAYPKEDVEQENPLEVKGVFVFEVK